MHAAAEQDHAGPGAQWPVQWAAGRRRPPTSRTDKIPPRLALLRDGETDDVHLRWRPGQSEAGSSDAGPGTPAATAPDTVSV